MNINIDFSILDETLDPTKVIIVDTSEWGEIKDSPAIIEITVPGMKNPIVQYFQKEMVTILNGKNLELQPVTDQLLMDLPDGLYKIVVKGSPDSFNKEKYFLKTDRIRLLLNKSLVTSMTTCGELTNHEKNKFIEIFFLIEAARAQVRLGNWCKATELYSEAEDSIKKLECYGM